MVTFIYGDIITGPERYKAHWCDCKNVLNYNIIEKLKIYYPDTLSVFNTTNNLSIGSVLYCRASTYIKPVICYCTIDKNDYTTVRSCLRDINKVAAGSEIAISIDHMDLKQITRIIDEEFFEAIPNIYISE